MSKCAVKRGILTLRDCGEEGINTCSICARPVCAEHTRIRSSDTICVECFAKGEEEAKSAKGPKAPNAHPPVARNEEEWNDPDWAYSYRHYYYMNSSYNPFYPGHYYSDYYDDYDVRSFTQGEDAQLDDESAVAGGFHDS
ncbi:MAG: hypothetical protein JWQ98_157 [Chlorobi bacterium]|nr:hypothetical protein [Chlorobiota bacterium]